MALEWWNSTDTTKLAPGGPGFSFDADGGIATALQEFHLWNNKGGVGAPTLSDLTIEFLGRLISTDDFVSEDLEFLESGFIEVRWKDTGEWRQVTPGFHLEVPALENNSYEALEVRVVSIVDINDAYSEVLIRIHQRGYTPLGSGHSEIVGNGVISGLGNRSKLSLWEFGNIIEDPGGASADVFVPDLLGNNFGELDFIPGDLITVGTQDDNAVTPLSGEAFYAAIIYDINGVGVVLGVNANTPLTDANKPVVPSTQKVLGWVIQDDTGTIENVKITNIWNLDRLAVTIAALAVTLHPGDLIVDNNKISFTVTNLFNLTDNDHNYLFVNRDHSFELNLSGIPEQNTAELIYEFITVAGVVTKVIDRRKIIGVQHAKIEFNNIATPVAVADKIYRNYPYNRKGYITKIISTIVDGSGAGDTQFNVEKSTDGAAFATIFGDATKKPIITGGDYEDLDSKPTDRILDGNERLMLEVDSVSAVAPTDFTVTLLVEIP
jgi:hypothetical protein